MNKIICGDALDELKKLPDECVDLCITSPPYYAIPPYYGIMDVCETKRGNFLKDIGQALKQSLRKDNIGDHENHFGIKNGLRNNILKSPLVSWLKSFVLRLRLFCFGCENIKSEYEIRQWCGSHNKSAAGRPSQKAMV